MAEVYALIAETWSLSAAPPQREHLDVVLEGVRIFPRDTVPQLQRFLGVLAFGNVLADAEDVGDLAVADLLPQPIHRPVGRGLGTHGGDTRVHRLADNGIQIIVASSAPLPNSGPPAPALARPIA